MKTAVSAPGKLMLFGEHAVVYGHPCIVTAVDSRLTAVIEPTTDNTVTITAPQVKDTRFVEAAITAGCQEWRITHTGMAVTTASDFPCTYGFGSSSAVTVAVLQALAVSYGRRVDMRSLFNLAYKVILGVQGVGSGFDAASAVFGGTLAYVVGGKRLDPLPAAPPIVIGYTGQKADTATIVREVGAKRDRYRDRVDRIFSGIAGIVDQAQSAIVGADWERVGKLMTFNQEYLRDLGVSTQRLEDLIAAANGAGAYGAKLSGAGGGDCMIAVVDPRRRSAVEDAIRNAGGTVVDVGVHAAGVGTGTTDDGTEQFIVVDEQDQVIGYRPRSECHRNPSLIHRTVGVAVFGEDGRVLLQKRSPTKDMDANKWGMSCAGHVTRGETYEAAAVRELEEELGIRIPLEQGVRFLTRDPKETEMAMLFRAKSAGPFTPNPVEVSEVRFFTRDEIIRMLVSDTESITEGTVNGLKAIEFL